MVLKIQMIYNLRKPCPSRPWFRDSRCLALAPLGVEIWCPVRNAVGDPGEDQSATTGWCPTWRCVVSCDGPWSEVTYGCGFKWNVLSLFVIVIHYVLFTNTRAKIFQLTLSAFQHPNLIICIPASLYSENFSTIFGLPLYTHTLSQRTAQWAWR